MFESVTAAPPDPILGLTEAFQKDDRQEKINLTIGVYRDEHGKTPILECVKQAEQRLLTSETTKGYLGIDGNAEFRQHACGLALADLVPADRVAAFQSPGGTGALRIAAEFASRSLSGARIWVSTPTWPNHGAIFEAAGLQTQPYPYLGPDGTSIDLPAMLETIERQGRAGDLICLHACCHNPTGIDPTPDQWEEIAELTAQRGVLPLVDFAYQGFGDGLSEDRFGLAKLLAQHEELLVCSSYSKNFGLYGERIGAMLAVCSSSEAAAKVRSRVKQTVRCNYSNPPRHGAAIVASVLADDSLRELWEQELTSMRTRIHAMRQQFVETTRQLGCPKDFSFLMEQRGMFSYTGLTPMQVDWLRSEKGIYIVGSGRINVAGITPSNLETLATAVSEAVRS